MSQDAGGPPPISRLLVKAADGKWAAAALAKPAGSPPPSLPHLLSYEDGGGSEWVRFVSGNVLEGWRAPRPRGRTRKGAAEAGPPLPPAGAATAVSAYVVVPEDAKTRGRPKKEVKEAQLVAEAAAEEYRRQRRSASAAAGGGADGECEAASGSPPKRRRLAAGSAPPAAAARPASPEAAEAQEGRPQQPTDGAAPSQDGAAPVNGAKPGRAQRRGRKAAGEATAEAEQEPADEHLLGAAAKRLRPNGEPHAPAEAAADGAGQGAAAAEATKAQPRQQSPSTQQQSGAQEPGSQLDEQQQHQQQRQGEAEERASEQQTPSTAEAAAAAASDPQPASLQPAHGAAGAHAAPAPGVAPGQELKRSAVTELGSGLLALEPLPLLPEVEEQGGAEPEARREKRRHAADAAASAGTWPSSREGSHRAHKDAARRQQQHQQQQQQAQEQPAAAAAPPPQPGPDDVACRAFFELLPSLTLQKESIFAGAAAALDAGKLGMPACGRVVRRVLEQMEQEGPAKRVTYLYLLDAILARSLKTAEPGCGPGSVVGKEFPAKVTAALSQLVELLGCNVDSARKLEKVLANTWCDAGKRGVATSMVHVALEGLRAKIAAHEAAWGGGAAAAAPSVAAPAGSDDGRGWASQSEAVLWRLMREATRSKEAPAFSYVNVKDGSKVTIVRRWQPAVWPDYSTLPLPPGTERRQFRGTKAAAEAHAQAAEAAGMPASAADGDSPWHATYDAAFWATRGYGPEHMPAAVHAVALERQRMAAMTAHLAQQRALMQQQRARGLSTAAEADEFDAGLFKEAAGGVAVTQAGFPPMPGFVEEGAWLGGAALQPPLPDAPPLPDDGWYDDEESLGPPPLPPHSPPRDEYAMDTDGDTPPPLPPSDDEGAPPPLPPSAEAPPKPGQAQQQAQQQYAAAWAGPPGFAPQPSAPAAGAQQDAAAVAAHAQQLGGWPPAAPGAAAMLPPGIGVVPADPAAVAAAAQQQQQLHQQQMWMMQQQQVWQQQQAAAAAMMAGASPGLATLQLTPQQMLYPAGMMPQGAGMMQVHMTQQQQQQAAAAALAAAMGAATMPGQPPLPRPPTLPPPG